MYSNSPPGTQEYESTYPSGAIYQKNKNQWPAGSFKPKFKNAVANAMSVRGFCNRVPAGDQLNYKPTNIKQYMDFDDCNVFLVKSDGSPPKTFPLDDGSNLIAGGIAGWMQLPQNLAFGARTLQGKRKEHTRPTAKLNLERPGGATRQVQGGNITFDDVKVAYTDATGARKEITGADLKDHMAELWLLCSNTAFPGVQRQAATDKIWSDIKMWAMTQRAHSKAKYVMLELGGATAAEQQALFENVYGNPRRGYNFVMAEYFINANAGNAGAAKDWWPWKDWAGAIYVIPP